MIRPAERDEIGAIGELIALSFNDLGPNAYLVPPPADRLRVLAGYFTMLTENAYEHGRVDVVPGDGDLCAAAVWFDGTRETPGPDDYDRRVDELAGPYRPNFDALDELFAKHHPQDPHWHLAFLAVRPGHQDHGLGTALMRERHRDLDRAGIPSYLEATNSDNIRLYRRHGYADMDPFEMPLPDGTPFYRMWRAA